MEVEWGSSRMNYLEYDNGYDGELWIIDVNVLCK